MGRARGMDRGLGRELHGNEKTHPFRSQCGKVHGTTRYPKSVGNFERKSGDPAQ